MNRIRRIRQIILIINILLTTIVGLLWIKNKKTETIVDKYEEKFVAITFDDGPNKATTTKLLDGLKERNVVATFFVVGENISGNEDLIRRMKMEGHTIGNHTYTHCDLSRVNEECKLLEVTKTNDLINDIIDERPLYIRPPFGSIKDKIFYIEDMTVVLWNIDPMDWNTTDEDSIVRHILSNVKPNDIILLHDIYETSVNAALRVIDELTNLGYTFVPIDFLMP